MWLLVEFVVLAAIVLLSITEFFHPLIVGKPLFPSFRKKQESQSTSIGDSLEDELTKAKEKIAEVKNIQEEVNKKFKSAEQLKNESDNLFNN
ncbi:MAG: hypothetical protein QM734_12170 [Cyclobacteriaceae bacterium]